jgi:hypothetical protein
VLKIFFTKKNSLFIFLNNFPTLFQPSYSFHSLSCPNARFFLSKLPLARAESFKFTWMCACIHWARIFIKAPWRAHKAWSMVKNENLYSVHASFYLHKPSLGFTYFLLLLHFAVCCWRYVISFVLLCGYIKDTGWGTIKEV